MSGPESAEAPPPGGVFATPVAPEAAQTGANQTDQRAAALDAANQVRIDRAKFKLRVSAGEVAAWKVVEDPPPFLLTTTVFDYLTWMPGIGQSRGSAAFKLLRKARVESHLRIGALTPNQRARLSETLHDYAHPRTGRDFKRPIRSAVRGDKHPAEKGWT